MTFPDFITTWTGKPCDFDKGGTYECVDLMRQYLQDVLGLPGYALHSLGLTGGAKDLFLKFTSTDAQHFLKIPNTTHPNNQPSVGDIVVFKNSTWFPFLFGSRGHVGIVMESGPMKMVVFNQNYPTGHMPQAVSFTYKDCLGWLHKI